MKVVFSILGLALGTLASAEASLVAVSDVSRSPGNLTREGGSLSLDHWHAQPAHLATASLVRTDLDRLGQRFPKGSKREPSIATSVFDQESASLLIKFVRPVNEIWIDASALERHERFLFEVYDRHGQLIAIRVLNAAKRLRRGQTNVPIRFGDLGADIAQVVVSGPPEMRQSPQAFDRLSVTLQPTFEPAPNRVGQALVFAGAVGFAWMGCRRRLSSRGSLRHPSNGSEALQSV